MATYTRLIYKERKRIRQLLTEHYSIGKIAIALGRSKSTISTEILRRGMTAETYNPSVAQADTNFRRSLQKREKKITGALEACISLLMLEFRWSPEQISNHLKIVYPNEHELHISPESIYKYVYKSPQRSVFTQVLRSKRKKRKSRKSAGMRRGGIKNRVSIHSRPAEVDDRKIPGHWEGDLIIGKGHMSAVGTLVERKTRSVIIVPLEAKDSESVVNAFISELERFPSDLKKSLTYDQGSEMAQHENFTRSTGMQVYFADPGSPWQRGSNENTNGLIREFFPKGTDFSKVTINELKSVEKLLNGRPRKVLGYQTPKQSMEMFLAS